MEYKKHCRALHDANDFVKGKSLINAIESSRSFAKRKLMKFHGIPTSTFYIHLKESEFRFTYSEKNIYKLLLKINKIDFYYSQDPCLLTDWLFICENTFLSTLKFLFSC